MIGAIEQRLEADGIADNTYLVFSSDNGFHAGQYRLMPGKLTAFDTDIRVSLGTDPVGIDPDFQQSASGSPRTYEAMRSRALDHCHGAAERWRAGRL